MRPEVDAALTVADNLPCPGFSRNARWAALSILAAEVRALREEFAQLRHNVSRFRCAEHATDASHAWGCPGCVADLRAEVRAQAERRCDTCTHYVQRLNCCVEIGDGSDVTPEDVHGTCGAWKKLETGV